MTEDETIALAVACNLGRTMTPLGMNTGEVFATDQSYRTAELFAFANAVRADEREACAKVCDAHARGWELNPGANPAAGFIATANCATAIRLRSNAEITGLSG